MRTAIENPDAMHRLQSQSLEEGSNYPQDGPDQSTWTRVLVRYHQSPSAFWCLIEATHITNGSLLVFWLPLQQCAAGNSGCKVMSTPCCDK